MLIYDFWHMVKGLVPLYIFLFGLQLIFRGVNTAFYIILTIGLLVSLIVNLNKFWNDYMGKNAVMVNMLPIGGFSKVFSKLLWGFIFSAVFFAVTAISAFKPDVFFITPLCLEAVVLVYLNFYSAMTLAKNSGRWYYIFFLMILLNIFTLLISFAVYFFLGRLITAAVMGIMILILFSVSMYCVEN